MGVVNRRWVWVECMAVVLRRYIDFLIINYYLYLLLLYLLFLEVASLLFYSFFKMFFIYIKWLKAYLQVTLTHLHCWPPTRKDGVPEFVIKALYCRAVCSVYGHVNNSCLFIAAHTCT